MIILRNGIPCEYDYGVITPSCFIDGNTVYNSIEVVEPGEFDFEEDINIKVLNPFIRMEIAPHFTLELTTSDNIKTSLGLRSLKMSDVVSWNVKDVQGIYDLPRSYYKELTATGRYCLKSVMDSFIDLYTRPYRNEFNGVYYNNTFSLEWDHNRIQRVINKIKNTEVFVTDTSYIKLCKELGYGNVCASNVQTIQRVPFMEIRVLDFLASTIGEAEVEILFNNGVILNVTGGTKNKICIDIKFGNLRTLYKDTTINLRKYLYTYI